MKFFSFVLLALASALVSSNAAITRPDQVLQQLSEIQDSVFDYQASVQSQLRTFRLQNGERSGEYFNKTLEIIDQGIKTISASDVDIRAALANETQTACISNLVNFIDQIVELSGYAISNCIEIKDNSTLPISSELTLLLEKFERKVDNLQEICVEPLVGRNVFTQGDEIIKRIKNLLEQRTTAFTEKLAELAEKAKQLPVLADQDFAALNSCLGEIGGSVQSGIKVVESQLAVCIRFGGRGARSVLPNPKNFFPKL